MLPGGVSTPFLLRHERKTKYPNIPSHQSVKKMLYQVSTIVKACDFSVISRAGDIMRIQSKSLLNWVNCRSCTLLLETIKILGVESEYWTDREFRVQHFPSAAASWLILYQRWLFQQYMALLPLSSSTLWVNNWLSMWQNGRWTSHECANLRLIWSLEAGPGSLLLDYFKQVSRAMCHD